MQSSGGRLRELLDQEAVGGGDLSPAGEPAVRAHLRLVAEALAATAGPATRDALETLAGELAVGSADDRDALEAERALLADAADHELGLQFREEPTGEDPSIRDMTDRRLRIQAATRIFLRRLGDAVGDPGLADAVLAWMADRQDQLANTIFSMDRRAKEAELLRHGLQAVDDPVVVNRIGQAAMLQAQMRFVVEAVAATMVVRASVR